MKIVFNTQNRVDFRCLRGRAEGEDSLQEERQRADTDGRTTPSAVGLV